MRVKRGGNQLINICRRARRKRARCFAERSGAAKINGRMQQFRQPLPTENRRRSLHAKNAISPSRRRTNFLCARSRADVHTRAFVNRPFIHSFTRSFIHSQSQRPAKQWKTSAGRSRVIHPLHKATLGWNLKNGMRLIMQSSLLRTKGKTRIIWNVNIN